MNPEPDGTCRTIKAQYYKNSLSNFIRGGGMERQRCLNMKRKMTIKTGGKRLARLIRGGAINRPYLWIDTYNQCVRDNVCGTIMMGVDFRNMYYVSVPRNEDQT